MFKLTAKDESGKAIQLTQTGRYTVTGISGLNPPKSDINYSAIGGQDGAVFNSARVPSRNIVLTVLPAFPVEQNRLNLYSVFKVKKLVTLEYKNGARNVKISGYVESIETDLFTRQQQVQISIICLQPYWQSAQTIVDSLSEILAMFEFPFETPQEGIVFSDIDEMLQTVVTNSGEVETGLIMEIFASGVAENPVIHNENTGEYIGVNITTKQSDLIRICTIKGRKSVTLTRDNATTNIINHLAPGSTWFSVPQGDTVLSLTADSGVDLLQATFYHDDLFEGV